MGFIQDKLFILAHLKAIFENEQMILMKNKLSIIIPVYNEKNTIKKIIKKVEDVNLLNCDKEIILVDDFSTDGSREALKNLKGNYVKIFQKKNMGKGAALKAGINAATGNVVVFQDADLEYDPNDFRKLLKPILERKTDVAFGSRFEKEDPKAWKEKTPMHPMHWIGNKGLNLIFNTLYGTKLTDVEPCYKMFKRSVFDGVNVKSNRFEYDIELMCKLVKKGHRIVQMPINYHPRKFEEGKKINWKDGLIAGWVMVKFRFMD